MIYLKSPSEIARIRKACNLWKDVKEQLLLIIKPHTSLKTIELKAKQLIEQNHGKCLFKGYQGFPGEICVSLNEVVIHGIASDYQLKPTDKVGIDMGIELDGVVCDAGFSVLVDPNSNPSYQDLIDHTYKALWAGIKAAKPGNYTGDITYAIENYVKQNCPQYFLIPDFTGHGCGIKLHEEPHIFNTGMKPKTGVKLVPNMVITIEPLMSNTSSTYWIGSDHWSVQTPMGGQVCHWEHMILITQDWCDVLTATQQEIDHFLKND